MRDETWVIGVAEALLVIGVAEALLVISQLSLDHREPETRNPETRNAGIWK